MVLSTEPVNLSAAQVEELARHLSAFRHDVNGCLSLIVAATELIRYNPDVVKRMAATLTEQPPRIAGKTREFVLECQRVMGIRPAGEASWYADLWKRHNAGPGEIALPASVPPDTAKALHGDLLMLNKELMQLAFIVSGASAVASAQPEAADDVTLTATEQLAKVTRRFDQFARSFEQALGVIPAAPRRLPSGTVSGPVSLSAQQSALFNNRLKKLERDLNEHIQPLLDLSRLARANPGEVQARSAEFAQQPPKISAEVNHFANEFDRTFGIVRAGA